MFICVMCNSYVHRCTFVSLQCIPMYVLNISCKMVSVGRKCSLIDSITCSHIFFTSSLSHNAFNVRLYFAQLQIPRQLCSCLSLWLISPVHSSHSLSAIHSSITLPISVYKKPPLPHSSFLSILTSLISSSTPTSPQTTLPADCRDVNCCLSVFM